VLLGAGCVAVLGRVGEGEEVMLAGGDGVRVGLGLGARAQAGVARSVIRKRQQMCRRFMMVPLSYSIRITMRESYNTVAGLTNLPTLPEMKWLDLIDVTLSGYYA
jgi:hypothetical protein